MEAKHVDMKFAIEALKYYGGWAGKVNGKTIEVRDQEASRQFQPDSRANPEFSGQICVHSDRAHRRRRAHRPLEFSL